MCSPQARAGSPARRGQSPVAQNQPVGSGSGRKQVPRSASPGPGPSRTTSFTAPGQGPPRDRDGGGVPVYSNRRAASPVTRSSRDRGDFVSDRDSLSSSIGGDKDRGLSRRGSDAASESRGNPLTNMSTQRQRSSTPTSRGWRF